MNISWCTKCLSMSTRPRISFNNNGICNACLWSEEKKTLNWSLRIDKLNKILKKEKNSNSEFDCLVPVSGGKDGSYVAYQLKHVYNMNPLCITITPHTEIELGRKNLRSFVKSGFNHISVNPNFKSMQKLNKLGFIQMGFPYFGWLIAIHTVPIIFANNFNINLIFYGEDGEVEYGGVNKSKSESIYNINYQKKIYLEGGYDKVISESNLSKEESYFFRFPENPNIKLTHWSYYENWDPYRNYLIAKKYCGLKESEDTNDGTFTNFSQNDQALYSLHTYLMFLKFGFGRANQDASIEIRRGAMNRDQAKNLVNLYDGKFPEEYINIYLEYYEMTKDEFYSILKKWTNNNLFEIEGYKWTKKFEIV